MELHQLINEGKLKEFKEKMVNSMKNYQHYNFNYVNKILNKELNIVTAKESYEKYLNIVRSNVGASKYGQPSFLPFSLPSSSFSPSSVSG